MRISSTQIVNPEEYKYKALIAASLGYFFDGIDFVALSLATPLLMKAWGLSLTSAGLLATSTLIGAAIGAYIWGPVSDKIGRRKAIMFCLIWFGLTTLLCGFCKNWDQLMVMRFITGLGLGGEWVCGTAFVTEFFQPKQRARASSIVMCSYTVGYLFLLALQSWLVPIYGWQVLFYAGILTFICVAYIYFYVPESPAWLKMKQNKELGIEVAPAGVSTSSTGAAASSNWKDLFNAHNRKALFLSIGLCSSILVGYWGANAWLPAYLSTVRGLDLRGLGYYLLVVNISAIIGGFFIWGFLADLLGRRWSFIIAGIASAMVFFAYMNVSSPNMVMVCGALFGLICLGYWGPFPIFVAEQFPTHIRGLGLSVSYATGRVMAALSPFVIGGVATSKGLPFAMGLVTIMYLAGAVFPIFMKETKTLEVVD